MGGKNKVFVRAWYKFWHFSVLQHDWSLGHQKPSIWTYLDHILEARLGMVGVYGVVGK